jgi:hypothetical protein
MNTILDESSADFLSVLSVKSVVNRMLKSTAFLSGLTRVEEGGMVGGPLAEDGLEVRSGGQGKPLLAFEVDFIPDEFH